MFIGARGWRPQATRAEPHLERIVCRGGADPGVASPTLSLGNGFAVVSSNSGTQASKLHAESKGHISHFDYIAFEINRGHVLGVDASKRCQDDTTAASSTAASAALCIPTRWCIRGILLGHGFRSEGCNSCTLRVRDSLGAALTEVENLVDGCSTHYRIT